MAIFSRNTDVPGRFLIILLLLVLSLFLLVVIRSPRPKTLALALPQDIENAWNENVSFPDSQLANSPIGLSLDGQIGGIIDQVVFHDGYIYFVNGPRVLIFDSSIPGNPIKIGQTEVMPALIENLKVRGDYLYTANGKSGVFIFDIADPALPQMVGSFDTEVEAFDIDVQGNYAFVADSRYGSSGGLRILDISDLNVIVEVGSYAPSSLLAISVIVSGAYAYVANSIGSLHIVDVSNPIQPALAAYVNGIGVAWDLEIRNSYLYVADRDNGLRIVDVSNPTAPSIVSTVDTPYEAYGVAINMTHAFIADRSSLRIIDITNPISPTETSFLPTLDIKGVAAFNNNVLLADQHRGLLTVDSTNPSNPSVIDEDSKLGTTFDFAIVGSTAFNASSLRGLVAIDTTNIYSPEEIGFYDTDSEINRASAVAVSGDYAYVINHQTCCPSGENLEVIDISNPTNMIRIGEPTSISSIGAVQEIVVLDDYAYLAKAQGGLHIYDFSNLFEPNLVSTFPGNFWDIKVVGNYAYLPDRPGIIRILDISDPANPLEVGFEELSDTSSSYYGIDVEGSYAYVISEWAGLHLVDISDPTNPEEVGYFSDPSSGFAAYDVEVLGDYAFVMLGQDENGVSVLDISNPTNPIEVQRYSIPLHTREIQVVEENVYVADFEGGLYILNWNDPYFLDFPVSYTNFSEAAQGNIGGAGPGRINSWFDHEAPNYQLNRRVRVWTGDLYTTDVITGLNSANCNTGVSCYDGHDGIDIQNRMTDEPIYAAAPGVVVEVCSNNPCASPQGRGSLLGKYVVIDHENGYATLYAHLKCIDSTIIACANLGINTTIDNRVETGTVLGVMGGTGRNPNYPIHLHFQVFYDSNLDSHWASTEVVDPYGWEGDGADPWLPLSRYLWIEPLWVRQSVNASGAVIVSSSGRTVIDIPPGAISSDMLIELWDAPVTHVASPYRSTGHSFWLFAIEAALLKDDFTATSGYDFNLPIVINLSFDNAIMPHLNEDQLAVYRWDESNYEWLGLETIVNTDQNTATAETMTVGKYDLKAPLLCPADVLEPNDNYDVSSILSTHNTPLLNLFDIEGDEDWFRFEAQAGQLYLIYTSNLASGVDTTIEIYNIDAASLLAFNDNFNGQPASFIEWISPEAGVYYVRVRPAIGSETGCLKSYNLNINSGRLLFLPVILK